MSKIQIFNNPQFGEIRTLEVNNQPYFVGSDIAKILGYQRPNDAITQHVDNEDTVKHRISDNQGVPHEYLFINESGVYALIFGSKLPKAKAFKRWVTSEVLPSIRKTGSYFTSKPSDPVLTNSFDISALTGRPHARIMKDIGRILEQGAGADDFIFRYRPVQTDGTTREYETYDITPKGLLTLATGYPPLLRDRIAARYAEITGRGSVRTDKTETPAADPEKKETAPDCRKGQTDTQGEINALKERIRRMEKQLRRITRLPDTPNENIFRQYPQYHSISVPMPTPDDLYNSMTFDNVRRKLYCDLGIEFSPVSLSEYLEAHGFVTNEGKDRLKPTKKAVDGNWILHPVEIPDEEDGIRLWRPRFTERGYMILVSRIRDFGAFEY